MGVYDSYSADHDNYVVCYPRENMIPTYCASCRKDVFMSLERLDRDPDCTPLCRGCAYVHAANKARRMAGLVVLPMPN